jgi:hypothetical protein
MYSLLIMQTPGHRVKDNQFSRSREALESALSQNGIDYPMVRNMSSESKAWLCC